VVSTDGERMSAHFEELDWRVTRLGEISLRRRLEPMLGVDVYEAKLGEEFLMSSLFTASEIALAEIALTAVVARTDLDVLVGGLGLGYTADAVLREPRVRSVHVVEALDEVIGWHRRGLLPLSDALTSDDRCHLVEGDFFSILEADASFGPTAPDRFDAIVVDIDHTPRHLLHPSHASFYEPEGHRRIAGRLNPGGVFGLWSDDPPDEDYLAMARRVFASCEAHVVAFANPLTGADSACTVYVASVGDR
jgi:spermidine synthase